MMCPKTYFINSSPPGQNGRHFADNILPMNFSEWKVFCILIKISLKFLPNSPINDNPVLFKIMAWRRIGDKPLSEPMLTRFTWRIYAALGGDELTHLGWVLHICISKWTIIGIWTNAGILLIEILTTNFNETSIKIDTFPFSKVHLKMLPGKWQPFCLGFSVLTEIS